jgi:RNA polymerase sigma-70 factor, ECF subfamily
MNADTDIIPISIPAVNEQSSAQHSLYREAALEFGPALARLVNVYEANAERRKDLLQEIHVALWRSFASFNRECTLRTWVYRVAHNTAATHVLRDKRQRTSQWVTLEQLEELPSEANDERLIDEAAVLRRLNKLIQGLKPIDRDVILLYLEEVEASEIAEIVGLSPSNVAQKIHRIKKVLQRHFDDGDPHVNK